MLKSCYLYACYQQTSYQNSLRLDSLPKKMGIVILLSLHDWCRESLLLNLLGIHPPLLPATHPAFILESTYSSLSDCQHTWASNRQISLAQGWTRDPNLSIENITAKLRGFCLWADSPQAVKLRVGYKVSVQFSCSFLFDSLWPCELQHARPACPSPTPGVHSNSCPSSQWCHPAISSSVIPFSSCPQSLQHQSLFQWVNSSCEVAKVLEFQLQHQSFQWTPRTDLLQNGLVGSPCSPRGSRAAITLLPPQRRFWNCAL